MNQRVMIRLLLACGVIGPLFFIVVFLIEGATRPGYSAWRHAVSQLSLGEQGWLNTINIFVLGWIILLALSLLRKKPLVETSHPENVGKDVQAEAGRKGKEVMRSTPLP